MEKKLYCISRKEVIESREYCETCLTRLEERPGEWGTRLNVKHCQQDHLREWTDEEIRKQKEHDKWFEEFSRDFSQRDGFSQMLADIAGKYNNVVTKLEKDEVRVAIEEGDDGFLAVFIHGQKGYYHFQYYPDRNKFEVDIEGNVDAGGNFNLDVFTGSELKKRQDYAKEKGRCSRCGSSLKDGVCPTHGRVLHELTHDAYVKLSKFMSFLLRHNKGKYQLYMDENGFVCLYELLQLLKLKWEWVVLDNIFEVVECSEKKRFEIVENNIRATYGHSVVVDVNLPSIRPPDMLYHGTTDMVLEDILRDGLKPICRLYVHLSETMDEAILVGKRRQKNPVVLKIDAKRAWENGVEFKKSQKIYLVKNLPPEYISSMKQG